MLDSLYTEAIKKKNSINDNVEDIFDKTLDVDTRWNSEKIIPCDNDYVLAAGDGSFNKKKFLGFNFYAVGAESLIHTPHDDPRLRTIDSVELDIMPKQSFMDDRLRNMMSIFEIKTAIKTFKRFDVDYYMVDGSILGDLIRPIPLDKDTPSMISKDMLEKIHETVKNEVTQPDLKISSLKFKEEFEELFDDSKSKERALISYLENLERLIAMKMLLTSREKIIAVSKTSTSNDIFHANVPDMAIFDKMTRNEGYSKPYRKKVNSEVKRDFPLFNNHFRSMWFTIVFARLEKNRNIIKIELPYHATDDEVKDILRIIKSNSTEGYPFLLKRAHNDVVIRHKDIESLSQIIEFLDRSGREMLD